MSIVPFVFVCIIISIILVITAIPDTITSVYTPDLVKQQEKQQNTEQQHNHDEHI